MRAVITGGPSVGKTTLIRALADLGFRVVEDAAAEILREGKVSPANDRLKFHVQCLRRQLFAEEHLKRSEEIVFLDGGIFDPVAYFAYHKHNVPPIFSKLDASKYQIAFIVEPLPYLELNELARAQYGKERQKNFEITLEISRLLEICYAKRGIKVVRVPFMTLERRLEFVLIQIRDLIGIGEQTPAKPVYPVRIMPALQLSLR